MSVNSNSKTIRKSKDINNPKDVEYLVNITSEEAAKKSTIMKLFANFGDGPKFNTYDTITIPSNKYGKNKKNKNSFKTTIGLWIFNKGCIEDVSDIVGYINKPINKKVYNDINKQLSYARLEDRITVQQLKNFIMQSQIYMSCTSALAPSHTMRMLLITTEIEKKKKQLEKKYADAIKNKDLKGIDDMEKELLDFAKEYMGDDPSMDMYDSGARSSWGNNFKNMYVMKGAVRLTDGSYDVVTSSYISGINKEEFSKTNDSMVGGPYARAVNTQNGGYLEKQFVSAFQHLVILPEGSDCGTKRSIEITLNKDNIELYMYCFVVEKSGRLVELTSDVVDNYLGKTVKLRYSSMCQSKKGICEKCAGTMFRRIGIVNIGVATSQIASTMKNASMKQFHDSTLIFSKFDAEKAFNT